MFRRRFLCGRLIVGLLVGVFVVQGVARPSAASTPPLTRTPRLGPGAAPSGSVALGALDPDQELGLSVVLAPSHASALHSLLSVLYDPSSPDFHRWLGRGQFAADFGPTTSEIAGVTGWLRGAGLTVTGVSGLSVHVKGPARRISDSLGVTFTRYRTRSGVRGYLSRNAPLVPA